MKMTEWMELTFCHFNDQRNLVEAWTKDPEIINKKVRTSSFLLIVKLLLNVDGEKVGDNSPSSSSSQQKGDG